MHPLQQDCDISNPKRHAAWCWAAGIPDPSPARPMPIPLIPPQLAESVSEMLWEFGFRHHPDLQTKWIDGVAGLGTVANLSKDKPKDDFNEMAEEFLSENDPQVLEAVRNASPEDKAALLAKLERNFAELNQLITVLKSS